MPVTLYGRKYYRTEEACRMAGTSKNTFFRWVKEARVRDTKLRDRRGWRLFAEDEVRQLKAEVDRVVPGG
jgi:excisionase family DNA binding protein